MTFLFLNDQKFISEMKWENPPLILIVFGLCSIYPFLVSADYRWGLSPSEHFCKITLEKNNLIIFCLGIFQILYIWPGGISSFITQTLRIFKIGGGIPIEVTVDHIKACQYFSPKKDEKNTNFKEDLETVRQVCNSSYQGNYRLTLKNLKLEFGYTKDLLIRFNDEPRIFHTIEKEFRPSIIYLPPK